MRKPSSPVGHLKIIMHKLRSVTLLCAGICAGVLSTVGITAYAEKQSAAPLPLAEIRQFTSAFNAIKDFYVDDVSDAKLLQSAVDGMVSGLDPHSSFLDVEGYKDMTESTQGSFGGLGLEGIVGCHILVGSESQAANKNRVDVVRLEVSVVILCSGKCLLKLLHKPSVVHHLLQEADIELNILPDKKGLTLFANRCGITLGKGDNIVCHFDNIHSLLF